MSVLKCGGSCEINLLTDCDDSHHRTLTTGRPAGILLNCPHHRPCHDLAYIFTCIHLPQDMSMHFFVFIQDSKSIVLFICI